MDYQLHYNPYRYNPKRTPYLMHLLPAHPNLQQDALEHARITGYGPYVVEHKRGVSYAMTMIPGDREVAHRWNLRQNDKTAVDINVMWKIDHNGAKMLRFDAWTAGARAHQVASMQELIDSYKPRARP
ncbi:hypothetical protein [Sporisorium scitamineum]|nr:hypothetical protein [Sporisorium scitamineum]